MTEEAKRRRKCSGSARWDEKNEAGNVAAASSEEAKHAIALPSSCWICTVDTSPGVARVGALEFSAKKVRFC